VGCEGEVREREAAAAEGKVCIRRGPGMTGKICVSYSRRDEATVRDLVRNLKDDGFDIWFDRADIRAGQKWKDEVSRVVEDALAVIVCVSSQWVNEKGYVHNELRLIIDASKVQPLNATWIIPVKLDEGADMPLPLKDLHYVDLRSSGGYGELVRALADVVGPRSQEAPNEKATSPTAFEEWFIDAIERGAVIHTDPWLEALSSEELDFKQLLRGRSVQGMDALRDAEYRRVLEIWAPLSDNEHFDIQHPAWKGRPYFLAQILSGKCQIFVALANLNNQAARALGGQALEVLQDLVRQPPFSMKGASPNRLAQEDARIQNLNYRDILTVALEWFEGWSPSVFQDFYEIPEQTVRHVIHTVNARIGEIDYLLQRFPT
jgi:hypothetical protein